MPSIAFERRFQRLVLAFGPLWGHSRQFVGPPMTSDLPPGTDIHRAGRHVSKVPGTDIGDAFETTRHALEFRVDERKNAEKVDDFPQ